ncbi:MAG: undecaprenyl/decaprenyl-phosphate alpha-N-acetylglucosaminyl 1-phosphate transferase [Clostridia bacterium]|nr:undecaprenyl/decaprenyl-phosphate alpha-N-acetylglucosaminyl 1-phosphate transferase [Clostridia bacterium]
MTRFDYLIVFLAWLVAGLISFLCTPAAKKLAWRIGAIDVPKDARRMHKKPIPRLGGFAIFMGFFVSTMVFTFNFISVPIYGILLGAMVIVALGMADDVLALKASYKFGVQLIAVAIPVVMGVRIERFPDLFGRGSYIQLPFIWSCLISVVWLLAILNAVNIIDGLDGLACGVSSIMTIFVTVILVLLEAPQVAVIAAALAGACMGFLPYNVNPAKMFMGDTGSMFIGYMLACLSIVGLFKAYAIVAFFAPVMLYLLPIFDLMFAATRRVLSGKSPMQADKSHLHHKLIALGFSQKQAVAILYGIATLLGFCAVLITADDFWKAMLVIGVAFLIIIVSALALYIRLKKTEQKDLENETEN